MNQLTFFQRTLVFFVVLLGGVSEVLGVVGIGSIGGVVNMDFIVAGTTYADRITTSETAELEVIDAKVNYLSSFMGSFSAGIYEDNGVGTAPSGSSPSLSTVKCSFDASAMDAGSCSGNVCTLPVAGGSCVLSADTNYWFYLTMNTSLPSGAVVFSSPNPSFNSEVTPVWSGNAGSRKVSMLGGVWMSNANTTLFSVTVVPEASTYAMIFGLVAMGFVVVRRKKW